MMNSIEIESWALRIVKQVTSRQPNEDSLVELKRDVPDDFPRTARHIAALINSSSSNHVLWIIGVDEKNYSVPGVGAFEMSEWWNKVATQFDEVSPSVQNISVNVGGPIVIALAFQTDRIPLVVKNPAGGRITREVPYRIGNRTDSARRSDLIRLLVPAVKMPNFEILEASFGALRHQKDYFNASASMMLYVLPQDRDRIVFPHHKISFSVEQNGRPVWENTVVEFHAYRGISGSRISQTIIESGSEIIIDGPGRFDVSAAGEITNLTASADLEFVAKLSPAGFSSGVTLKSVLHYSGEFEGVARWKQH